MHIDNPTTAQLEKIFAALDQRAASRGGPVFVKYLALGSCVVRLVNYSDGFTPHVEAQLTYILRDDAPHYDATLIVWQENAFKQLAEYAIICDKNSQHYRQMRLNRLFGGSAGDMETATIVLEDVHHRQPVVEISSQNSSLSAWNPRTNTYYYAVDKLEPEEFIKRGHLFVHALGRIIKSPTSNLAHGAVVGLNGQGVLLCGMGYRGKSTFSVNALLHGFEYVSDDYLILEKDETALRAWPIYSIITLSPAIYQKMAARLDARFVSNNARKDKYVFNIAKYHERFVSAYPVKLCMFPRFIKGAEPSIELGSKDIAVDEFAYSTVMQTGETLDMRLIAKLCSFVEDMPFYRINLTADIDKNTQCLRAFLERCA